MTVPVRRRSRARRGEDEDHRSCRGREEGQKLQGQLQQGNVLFLLDERGKALSSEDLAARIGQLRDSGRKALVIAIGGADGHHKSLREEADLVLSFGALTWPHQLVRVMLGEQLYRIATILAGHPYHRS
ncbi:MAG: 23S rRNA (pseudouridine(1915)-N(3))-methyltransferase RlmH [Mesorhizobium sp.]|nr:MAG: 23S rRNA (pseudouridine(1915)-N(3))-methyltransferase RlmH [Mesorhizobium sp.]